MTMADLKCDVCGRSPASGVASSPFVAMSFAYCHDCLEKPADCESVFAYLWEDVANFDLTGLHSAVFRYHTWRHGRYWRFRDWVKKFGRTIEQAAHDDIDLPPAPEDSTLDGQHRSRD